MISTGTVKTFVRDTTQGGQLLMRRLKEGDFFGEISVLSGKARSATVTAATHCELLELDRATLDQITTVMAEAAARLVDSKDVPVAS